MEKGGSSMFCCGRHGTLSIVSSFLSFVGAVMSKGLSRRL
jgi:hypothetical protein